ncbi:hypothetical protein [Rhodococcoides corynebacterioides]|uniref:hypothetical protein n=1 Tax=Rhodococcoides corynebacterioides TaxID=53972 RepID=UPI001C9B2CA3|nr:hypothetical protein [Rhodococcus corynebacterioides]
MLSGMVSRPSPENYLVVAGSTSVIALGDPGTARVITLEITLSAIEFVYARALLTPGSTNCHPPFTRSRTHRAPDLQGRDAVIDACAATPQGTDISNGLRRSTRLSEIT